MKVRFYPEMRRTGFQELLSYYPRFYAEVDEMVAILKYFGDLCDFLEANTEQAYLNYFLMQADDETLSNWERVLNIRNKEGRTLEQRRSVILGKLLCHAHIGEPEIRETIAAYTPNEVWIDFDLGIIYIVIQGNVFGEDDLIETLYEKVPAHLKIDMKIEIKRLFREDLPIGQGGAIGTFLDFEPFDVYRKDRQDLEFGMGARVPKTLEGAPNNVNREFEESRGHRNAGFYQTRVKGKLVG